MAILIRQVRRDRRGNEELFEETVDGSVVTVGRRNDQVIQLLDPGIAPQHLALKAASGGRFHFSVVGAARVVVDGKPKRRGTLEPGDSIELGSQTLAVADPAAGFKGVLELTLTEMDREIGSATHFRTQLSHTGLGSRKPAWTLAVAVLLLFLFVPLAGHFWPDLGDALRRQPLLPSDHVWLSGPLSNAHHTPEIGDDCNKCHLDLFERAPDRGCLHCHGGVTGHVNKAKVAAPSLESMRCAYCHEEHNEPPMLVRTKADLCLDCHEEPRAMASPRVADVSLPKPVEGFARDAHPAFRLAMLRQTGRAEAWETIRVEPTAQGPAESSNLKFPHDLHLDPGKVTSLATGEALQCGDCHRLREDGEHFEPITMERGCRGCHSLQFDDDMPEKQLPHGEVRAVVVALEEHFIRKYADPELRGGRERIRRRPGQAQRTERCEGPPLECGRQAALREATSQFERSGCVTCHQVEEQPEQPMLARWRVEPVRLADDWYPYGRFDHVAHLTQGGAWGESGCTACHGAQSSGRSADVLIPGIENCVACHGDEGETTTVALSCRGCHGFHLPDRGVMRTARSSDNESNGSSLAESD